MTRHPNVRLRLAFINLRYASLLHAPTPKTLRHAPPRHTGSRFLSRQPTAKTPASLVEALRGAGCHWLCQCGASLRRPRTGRTSATRRRPRVFSQLPRVVRF